MSSVTQQEFVTIYNQYFSDILNKIYKKLFIKSNIGSILIVYFFIFFNIIVGILYIGFNIPYSNIFLRLPLFIGNAPLVGFGIFLTILKIIDSIKINIICKKLGITGDQYNKYIDEYIND